MLLVCVCWAFLVNRIRIVAHYPSPNFFRDTGRSCPPDTIPKKMHLSLSLKGNWYIPSDIYDNRKSSSFSILSSRACVQMPHVSRSQHGKESFNQLPQMAFQWWHLNHVEKLTTSSSIHQQRDTELAQVGHSTGRQWLAPLSRIHKSQTVAETFRNKQ